MPPKAIGHDVQDALIIGSAAQQEIYVDGPLCESTFPVHATLALFHLRGIPFKIVVNYVPAVLLEIDTFLADGTGDQHQRLEGGIEASKV